MQVSRHRNTLKVRGAKTQLYGKFSNHTHFLFELCPFLHRQDHVTVRQLNMFLGCRMRNTSSRAYFVADDSVRSMPILNYCKATNFYMRFIFANYMSQAQVA